LPKFQPLSLPSDRQENRIRPVINSVAKLFGARARVVYLGGVAVGAFLLPHLWQIGVLCAVQAGLWLAVGLPARRLLTQIGKLWGFALFIIASYALTSNDPATDQWTQISLLGFGISLNSAGALVGVLMVLRIIAVVIASQVARSGDPRAIVSGLRQLGMPQVAAISIDTVLSLLGETDGGRRGGGGRGDGSGGGRRSGEAEASATNRMSEFWAGLKRLGRGDVTAIVSRLERQIGRAESHAEAQDLDARGRAMTRDIGVIAGVALTMLGIKALKILPSVPFAPGHKLVILTPLYVIAGLLTRTPFGSTLTGLTMGTVAFLLGDGRYGIFEILKHVAPGVICDLGVPFIAAPGQRPGPIVWSIFGGVIAAGRFATIFGVVLLTQAPAMAYAILLPGMTVHVTFGVLSGYVTYQLVRGIEHLRAAYATKGEEIA
jgi:cobalt transport protein